LTRKSQNPGYKQAGRNQRAEAAKHLIPHRQLDSKLFEEAESVPDDSGFDDFAVADLIDGDAAEGDFLVRRGDAKEFAAMRSGNSPVND